MSCDTVEHATPTNKREFTARSISAATWAGADASPFPTQIRFQTVFNFLPLPERCFKHIMDYAPNSNRFKFELTPQQVAELLNAFKVHDAEKQPKA